MNYTDKVILALDNYSVPMAEEIISHWQGKVHGFKLNHVLFPKIGKQYQNIFCDYKLFDIPNTMEKVVESVIDDGADMISVHINNNHTAIEALAKYAGDIKLLGVTYLTSWDHNDLQFVYNTSSAEIYKRAVWLMKKYGFSRKIAFDYIKEIRPTIHNSENKIVFYNSLK